MDDFGKFNDITKPERQRGTEQAKKRQKTKKKLRNNDPLKIVYISSPMKVKTCESKFRSLVQELTGKDSQVAMFMDVSSSRTGEGVSGQVSGSSSRSLDIERVAEKVDLLEQWPVRSDQSFSVVEEELRSYVMDEGFAVGGGCDWDSELPWHLFAE